MQYFYIINKYTLPFCPRHGEKDKHRSRQSNCRLKWDEQIGNWLAAMEKLKLQAKHLHVLEFQRMLFSER